MLIRCKLIRVGGSIITLGKGKDAREYHFKPADPAKPNENHVCDVANAEDVSTFLAIREGYEVHESELAKPRTEKAENKDKAPPVSSQGAVDVSKLSKPQLIELVEKKTGKKPHASTSVAKLIAALK